MLRNEFWLVAASIGLLGGCASPPKSLPACTSANSPNSICGLMNPEDLSHLPGREWVVVSQMASTDSEAEIGAPPTRPGSLLAVRIADGARHTIFPATVGWELELSAADEIQSGDPDCPGPPSEVEFEPHGIDVGHDDSGTPILAVVNHGGREAVEFFEIESRDQPSVAWRGCVVLPEDFSANDLALFGDGGFVVTRITPRIEGIGPGAIWTFLKIAWGWNTGSVYRWTPGGNLIEVPGSAGSAPNGVAISRDETEIFVAQWGEANVYRVSLAAGESGSRRREAALGHHPDNLTWTDDGRLLTAGQAGSIRQILGCGGIEKGGCAIDYGVYAIDPETFEVEQLFSGMGAASVALEVGDDIFVGAFSGDQIERVSSPR